MTTQLTSNDIDNLREILLLYQKKNRSDFIVTNLLRKLDLIQQESKDDQTERQTD